MDTQIIDKINKPVNMENYPFSHMHYHTLPAISLHAFLNSSFSLPFCDYALPSFLFLFSLYLSLHSHLVLYLHPSTSLHKFLPVALPHLRLDVSVVVILEQQCGRLCVIFAGRDVQGREADLTLGVVLQQQGDH